MSGKVKVGTAVVAFAKAPGEDAANNAYGYDDFDTAGDFSDDHVSTKNGGDTYVQVTIAGTTMYDKVFMVSADEAKVKVSPEKATGASSNSRCPARRTRGEPRLRRTVAKRTAALL